MIWVPGVSLTHGGEVLVPGCAVYLRHRPPDGSAPPMSAGSAGLSAHCSAELAREHGLLEVLERDLFWRAWYGNAPLEVICPTSAAEIELDALGLERTILLVPGPGGAACVVVCLSEPGGRHQSFGARAVPRTDDAALSAATEIATYEALMVRWSMNTPSAWASWRDLTNHGSPEGPLQHALHAFHRQDSLCHLLADPDRPGRDRSASSPPSVDRDLATVLAGHTGQDVIWVNTTVADVELAPDQPAIIGRVVAPGARRLPGIEERIPAQLHTGTRLPHPLG